MSELEWQDEPPAEGTFFFTRHERMSPTMTLRLGERLVFFGDESLKGPRFDEWAHDAEYWGPLPEPTD